MSLLVLLACASPGTLTVAYEGVTGAEGLLLITEARDAEGKQAAISCVEIDADPFDVSVTLEEIVGSTPCEDSAPIVLGPGPYDLTVGVLAGGDTEPSQCGSAQVTVDGDVRFSMPALSACD